MQDCAECLRMKALLRDSSRDCLAAVNRYNTILFTGLDNSWAEKALQAAKIAHAERQREFDAHIKKHHSQARWMTAGQAEAL